MFEAVARERGLTDRGKCEGMLRRSSRLGSQESAIGQQQFLVHHLEVEAVTVDTSFLDPSFWILTLPLKYAPSSMEMRWAAMSPVTTADCFRSTRSLA